MTDTTKLVELKTALNSRHIERHDEIEIALSAILCQYHVVLIGPPGTAKSMLADDLTTAIDGARSFKYLMTKFTTPEEIYGPWNLKKLQEGVYERILTGRLAESDIAFLDEFFKANSAIQNTMLTVMNERTFDNGTGRNPVPLTTVFAASNEMPDGEELWALFDRFHFRKIVDYIKEPTNFMRMLQSDFDEDIPQLTFAELQAFQSEVKDINVPDNSLETLHNIRADLDVEGVIVSDRRYRQSIRVLQSQALLAGRDSVDDADFSLLQHMLWTNPVERQNVARKVLQHTNPLELAAQEIIDQVDSIAGELNAAILDARQKGADAQQVLVKQGIEWFSKCKTLGTEVTKLDQKAKKSQLSGGAVARVEQARARVMQVAREIGRQCMGIDTMDMKVEA